MLVTIRKDLKDDYSFSTDSGILIDNDSIYQARYNEGKDNQFEIFINESWENIEGIDFEILNNN